MRSTSELYVIANIVGPFGQPVIERAARNVVVVGVPVHARPAGAPRSLRKGLPSNRPAVGSRCGDGGHSERTPPARSKIHRRPSNQPGGWRREFSATNLW